MKEEQVTKIFLQWLIHKGWKILAFDFPQSGTGVSFKKNSAELEKNKESIIPDIICIKDKICTFWENKNRYYYPDYEKVEELRLHNQYTRAICEFLKKYEVEKIYYGIGLPTDRYQGDAIKNRKMVDFIVGANEEEKTVEILHDENRIFG